MASGHDGPPSPLVLLMLSLVMVITAVGLAGYGFSTLARQGVRRSGIGVVLRSSAALAASTGIAMYAWGALHLVGDETMTVQACRDAVGREQSADIDRYEFSYIPLNLGCHVKGDGTYAAAIPEYVNPAMLGLAVLTATLAIFAAIEAKYRGRQNYMKGMST